MFGLGLKENDKRVIIISPTKIEQMYGWNGRATYMTNEQLIAAIIKLLSNISRNESLELIYELTKRLQD